MERIFRQLTADEVEARFGQDYGDWITLLLYKDARADMNILDETVGAVNWQRKHYEVKGNLYCSVGIYDVATEQWVWKDDCGTESRTEKEKGEASDSFKRACVNWGIGRELYNTPPIFVKKEKLNYGKDGKLRTRFKVQTLEFNVCDEVSKLIIVDAKSGEVLFEHYAYTTPKAQTAEPIKYEKVYK